MSKARTARERDYHREYMRRLRANPEYRRREFETRHALGYWLKHRYGITLSDYDAMFERQGGLCAICRQTERIKGKAGGRMCVDHDHDTGKVRGLLCHSCNTGIGKLGDSVDNLQRAIEYLRASSS